MRENFTHGGAALFALMREIELAPGSIALPVAPGRLSVLRALARMGPSTASELARARGSSRQGVQRIADDLTRCGWVRRLPNPRHRRAALFELTPAGNAVYDSLVSEETRAMNRLAEGLSSAEIQGARKLLAALRQRALA